MNRRLGKHLWAALAAAALALAAVFFAARPAAPACAPAAAVPAAEGASPRRAPASAAEGKAASARADAPVASAADDGDAASASDDAGTDEETRRVDAFDALTDAWREPAAKIAMPEVARFRDQFSRLPPARKPECLQRALNLVPDENVMLLAGILFDKAQPAEILEDVFNDILTRDEGVKTPILQTIFKDKSHPCWADAAWILDAAGERPAAPAEEAVP